MRDIHLLAATMRLIRDGGGAAVQNPNLHGSCWLTGPVALNSQAVSDLIEDGWLKCPDGRGKVVIDAWPAFARQDEIPAMAKRLARELREIRAMAEEYAEMGRDFPLFGAGSLFNLLDGLGHLVSADGGGVRE